MTSGCVARDDRRRLLVRLPDDSFPRTRVGDQGARRPPLEPARRPPALRRGHDRRRGLRLPRRRGSRGRRPTSFGIQGSGPLVGGLPSPDHFARIARAAEDAGFDSLWAGDHVSFHEPLLDVTVALSAFAAVTERIALGAGVLLLPLRAPALVAREFASLDYLSGGRLILGVGVGGEQPDGLRGGRRAGPRAGRPDGRGDRRAARALRARRRELRGPVLRLRRHLDRARAGAAGRAAALGRGPVRRRRSAARPRPATAGCRSGSHPSGSPRAVESGCSADGERAGGRRGGGAARSRRRNDARTRGCYLSRRYDTDVLGARDRALLPRWAALGLRGADRASTSRPVPSTSSSIQRSSRDGCSSRSSSSRR